jgi:hypothetical protein
MKISPPSVSPEHLVPESVGPERFAMAARSVILDATLSDNAFRIWSYLDLVNGDRKTPRDIDYGMLARQLSRSESTVKRGIKELVLAGLLVRKARYMQATLTTVMNPARKPREVIREPLERSSVTSPVRTKTFTKTTTHTAAFTAVVERTGVTTLEMNRGVSRALAAIELKGESPEAIAVIAEAWLLTLNPSDPAAVLAWILRQMADGKPAPAPAKIKASLREQAAEHRSYLMPRTPEERIIPEVAPEVGARGAAACRAAAGLSSPSHAIEYASASSAS